MVSQRPVKVITYLAGEQRRKQQQDPSTPLAYGQIKGPGSSASEGGPVGPRVVPHSGATGRPLQHSDSDMGKRSRK